MDKRVAVLGAGPMGLAVAYQLIKEGYIPVVYEADDRVGGMTATFDFSGTTIERYYHFHCISDHAFLKLIDELNIADKMHWTSTKMGFWFQNRLQPWGNPIALLRFKGLSLQAKFRYGLHAFLSTKRNDWKPLDGLSAVDWIKSAVGQEAYETLWRTLFEYKFYHYTNHLSAAWIWSRIRRIGRSRYSLFKEKLGYLEGGSETLLSALKHYIEANGGEIKLKSAVSKVMMNNEQVQSLQVNGETIAYDKVISTIPLPYVANIMPDLPQETRQMFQNTKNIAVVCVIAKLRKPVTENFWVNINDPEMDIPGMVEYTNLRPMDHHIAYVPFYMPAEIDKFKEADEVFTGKVKAYFKKINPTLVDADFIDIKASRYRFAQPICEPNFLTTIPASFELPVRGLFVADTSYYYPEDRGISESIDFGRMMAKKMVANQAGAAS